MKDDETKLLRSAKINKTKLFNQINNQDIDDKNINLKDLMEFQYLMNNPHKAKFYNQENDILPPIKKRLSDASKFLKEIKDTNNNIYKDLEYHINKQQGGKKRSSKKRSSKKRSKKRSSKKRSSKKRSSKKRSSKKLSVKRLSKKSPKKFVYVANYPSGRSVYKTFATLDVRNEFVHKFLKKNYPEFIKRH